MEHQPLINFSVPYCFLLLLSFLAGRSLENSIKILARKQLLKTEVCHELKHIFTRSNVTEEKSQMAYNIANNFILYVDVMHSFMCPTEIKGRLLSLHFHTFHQFKDLLYDKFHFDFHDLPPSYADYFMTCHPFIMTIISVFVFIFSPSCGHFYLFRRLKKIFQILVCSSYFLDYFCVSA